MSEGGELKEVVAGDSVHLEATKVTMLLHQVAMSVVKTYPDHAQGISVCMTAAATVAGALYGILVCEGLEPDNKGQARMVADSMSRNFLEGIKLEKSRQARVAREGGQVQ